MVIVAFLIGAGLVWVIGQGVKTWKAETRQQAEAIRKARETQADLARDYRMANRIGEWRSSGAK